MEILGEVKEFLEGLAQELPLVFKPAPPKASSAGRVHKHLPYRGQDVPVRVLERPGEPRTEVVHEEGELRLLRGDDRLAPHAALREFLIDRARETFTERAAHWAPRIGVRYSRLTIRDQRTVWGSCTKAGHLSFNWRIIMAPPAALDYLVIHELSHLREMNHSKRFWSIVAEHCPDWKAQRGWLRDHSRRLKAAVKRA